MANFVPKFSSYKINFLFENEILQSQVLDFIREWNNESNFFTSKTSGSTGIPKEINLLKKHALASAKMTGKYFYFSSQTKIALALSPETIAGKMQILRALTHNSSLVILENTRNPLKNLEEQIDFISLVPLQLQEILSQNPEKLSLCKQILIGGAKIPLILEEKLWSLKSEFYESYGMTETLSHIALRKIDGKNDSFQALDGISLEEENGNLIISAPHLGLERLRTNDSVEFTRENCFKLIGRSDFVINSGGYKFHPEFLERKLETEIPSNFFILGEKENIYGEIVTFYIESNYSVELEKKLKEQFEKKLTAYEKPKKIYFLDTFVKTESGKIDRLACQKLILER